LQREKLCKALVRPVITYGAQAWTLRTVDEQALRVFKRTVLRRIYGPVFIQGEWRLRTNAELDNLLGHADLVRFIVSETQLAWIRQENGKKRIIKNILKDKMHGTKRKGRPRKRRGTGPEDDGRGRMENEGSRSTGVEEGYQGGQGPSWIAAPVNEMK
jgi:hypothetical protein